MPLVRVPVLSRMMAFTSFMVCIASPFRMRIPCSAPMPVPTIRAVGVARPRAHGQAITRVATKAEMASIATGWVESTHGRMGSTSLVTVTMASGAMSQRANVARDITITAGTK